MRHGTSFGMAIAVIASFMATSAGFVQAAINPSQVLVVYNSQAPDGQTILNAYLAVHPDIPAGTNQNVFDLNDASLVGVADITYADFVSKIRDPIRAYLDSVGPTATSIISIVLIRGIPHRIEDTDRANVGDVPSWYVNYQDAIPPEFTNGDVTCASVDAELVLLWQDLDDGEAGGTMDSHADNLIDNPYHQSSTNIQSFTRANIKVQKTLSDIGNAHYAWGIAGTNTRRLTSGDIYLVCRIDGTTAADALAIIARAQDLAVNRRYARLILDEDDRADGLDDDAIFTPPVFGAGADYEETRDLMQANGWNVLYDATDHFIEGGEIPRPVIAYSSYGTNHDPKPPSLDAYIDSFVFARGAIFNTFESYNGRAFNGLGTLFGQEQIADFISAGGTFGIGCVWEPLSVFLADDEFLWPNFLVNGLTWAEAAYSSIPALSWMHIVIGDPLAHVVTVNQRLADLDADNDVDQDDLALFEGCTTGPSAVSMNPDCADTDFDLDDDIDMSDFATLQLCLSSADIPPAPACN